MEREYKSYNNQTPRPKQSRFTRGEKCIFYHILATLCILIVLLAIYLAHLWIEEHKTLDDSWKIYGRTTGEILITNIAAEKAGEVVLDGSRYRYIGVTYLNITLPRIICNTLLIREHWSLAPAQCTAMRDQPEMSEYLPFWIIKYMTGEKKEQIDVKRSLTHSHFDRRDFQNNIGLFEHQEIVMSSYFIAPSNVDLNYETLNKRTDKMAIVNWRDILLEQPVAYQVRPLTTDECDSNGTSIMDALRKYEFCVTLAQHGPTLDRGAVLVLDQDVVGFFSWGDVQAKGVPFIMLNLLHFKDWFESMTSL